MKTIEPRPPTATEALARARWASRLRPRNGGRSTDVQFRMTRRDHKTIAPQRRLFPSIGRSGLILALPFVCGECTPGRSPTSEQQPAGIVGAPVLVASTTPAASHRTANKPSGPELQRLLAREGPFNGDLEEGISVRGSSQRVLRQLKDSLVELADAAIASFASAGAPDAILKRTFVAAGYDWADQHTWKQAAVDGSVSSPAHHPDRRAVELCLLLAPGSDCILILYRGEQGRWRRELELRSDDYSTIQGALHSVYWELSPPDRHGSFYLLEAHTFPWPASRWRDFTYRALAPTTDPRKPNLLASGRAGGNWENGYRLVATPDQFSIEFDVWSDEAPDFQKTERHVWVRTGERFVRK